MSRIWCLIDKYYASSEFIPGSKIRAQPTENRRSLLLLHIIVRPKPKHLIILQSSHYPIHVKSS